MSCRILLNPLSVRDVEYTPHENTGKRKAKPQVGEIEK